MSGSHQPSSGDTGDALPQFEQSSLWDLQQMALKVERVLGPELLSRIGGQPDYHATTVRRWLEGNIPSEVGRRLNVASHLLSIFAMANSLARFIGFLWSTPGGTMAPVEIICSHPEQWATLPHRARAHLGLSEPTGS